MKFYLIFINLTLSTSRLEFLHFLDGLSINYINGIVFLSLQRNLQTFILVSGTSFVMETVNKLSIGYLDFCERSGSLFPRRAVTIFWEND